ncbi:hypothetical protein D3C72_2093360 [compost metagenome]
MFAGHYGKAGNQHARDTFEVAYRATVPTDRVETLGQGFDTFQGNQPKGRLEGMEAAIGSGLEQ